MNARRNYTTGAFPGRIHPLLVKSADTLAVSLFFLALFLNPVSARREDPVQVAHIVNTSIAMQYCAGVYHSVRPGQTIYSIAAYYGSTAYRIAACNSLRTYRVYVGQTLLVPTRQTSYRR